MAARGARERRPGPARAHPRDHGHALRRARRRGPGGDELPAQAGLDPLLIHAVETMRAPTRDEAEAVTDLVIACDIHELGAPDFELDDLLTDWNMPGFDLEHDAVVVEVDGGLAAYASFIRNDYVDVYVKPEHRELGLGAKLLDWAERRAVERAGPGAFAGTGRDLDERGRAPASRGARLPARCARTGGCPCRSTSSRRRRRGPRASTCARSTRSGTRGPSSRSSRTRSATTSATPPSPSRSGRPS